MLVTQEGSDFRFYLLINYRENKLFVFLELFCLFVRPSFNIERMIAFNIIFLRACLYLKYFYSTNIMFLRVNGFLRSKKKTLSRVV